jgi:hypothetical protein
MSEGDNNRASSALPSSVAQALTILPESAHEAPDRKRRRRVVALECVEVSVMYCFSLATTQFDIFAVDKRPRL